MSIIERISARSPIRRAPGARTLLALLLAAAALCGCARHYDIILTNSQTVTNVRIPNVTKGGPTYTYITAGGHQFTIPAGRVAYICPHGDTNWMFKKQ
jgi:hypothetical protein